MPRNSVAVFFSNAIRNRSNDVYYKYHQDPDFYYLTGHKEPHSVLLIFSEMQSDPGGKKYNEVLYIQKRDKLAEQWNGYRLGIERAKDQLQINYVFNGHDFIDSDLEFGKFDKVMYKVLQSDVHDNPKDSADLADLQRAFLKKLALPSDMPEISTMSEDNLDEGVLLPFRKANLDTLSLMTIMAGMREIKTEEELTLLRKAAKISAIGQREIMKALNSEMSELEIQGVHEFIYRSYGSEYEGYPSIVGSGENGCILHYITNNKTKVSNDLVLMDLGAEYHGYTADVTRTIPADGIFSPEEKEIYKLVYEAQNAGIAASLVGNPFHAPDRAAREIIYKGLVKLGIAKNEEDAAQYFPHGTTHYLGLDVHDAGLRGNFKPNMVITVEPGIYISRESNCEPKWHGIAIRIEDDILITPTGPENLSEYAPRSWEEIEKIMREKSVLNSLKLPKLD